MAKSWELRKIPPPLFSSASIPKQRARHLDGIRPHIFRQAREETRLLLRLGLGRRSFLHCCRRLRRGGLCRSLGLGGCSLGLGGCCLLRGGLRRCLCNGLLSRRRFLCWCSLLCRRSLGLGRRCFLHCWFCRGLCGRLLGRCRFCLRLGSRCCFLNRSCCFRRRCLYWCFLCRCLGCRRF